MRKNWLSILILILVSPLTTFTMATDASADSEQIASALAATAGRWSGELFYLDYQSGERFSIPLRVEASTTPDAATLVRELTFTDPGVLVHAISLLTLDRDSEELVEAYFREGRGELFRFEVVSFDRVNAGQWSLTYKHNGTDDGRSAEIRHTLERDGPRLSSVCTVRFLDEPDAGFFQRNGTELTMETQSAP